MENTLHMAFICSVKQMPSTGLNKRDRVRDLESVVKTLGFCDGQCEQEWSGLEEEYREEFLINVMDLDDKPESLRRNRLNLIITVNIFLICQAPRQVFTCTVSFHHLSTILLLQARKLRPREGLAQVHACRKQRRWD